MSIVNAEGNLTDPHKFLLRTAQALTNSPLAPDPEPMPGHDDRDRAVYAANGEYAGEVGGIPHRSPEGQKAARRHRGAGTAMSALPRQEPSPAPGKKKRAK